MLALVCAVIMNCNRTKASDKIHGPEDFLLFASPPKRRQSGQEIETKLRAMFSGINK